ncbi:hypothetical protein BH18ACI4_BH18ACI4_06380 [soil metagenome]
MPALIYLRCSKESGGSVACLNFNSNSGYRNYLRTCARFFNRSEKQCYFLFADGKTVGAAKCFASARTNRTSTFNRLSREFTNLRAMSKPPIFYSTFEPRGTFKEQGYKFSATQPFNLFSPRLALSYLGREELNANQPLLVTWVSQLSHTISCLKIIRINI